MRWRARPVDRLDDDVRAGVLQGDPRAHRPGRVTQAEDAESQGSDRDNDYHGAFSRRPRSRRRRRPGSGPCQVRGRRRNRATGRALCRCAVRRGTGTPCRASPASRADPPAPGVFVEVGAIGVRYDPKLHEGDASYEWFGDLTLRCGDRTERPLELRKRGMELGGTAVLFQAGAGEPFAISIDAHGSAWPRKRSHSIGESSSAVNRRSGLSSSSCTASSRRVTARRSSARSSAMPFAARSRLR